MLVLDGVGVVCGGVGLLMVCLGVWVMFGNCVVCVVDCFW